VRRIETVFADDLDGLRKTNGCASRHSRESVYANQIFRKRHTDTVRLQQVIMLETGCLAKAPHRHERAGRILGTSKLQVQARKPWEAKAMLIPFRQQKAQCSAEGTLAKLPRSCVWLRKLTQGDRIRTLGVLP